MKTHITNPLNPSWTMCDMESGRVDVEDVKTPGYMNRFTCLECRNSYDEAAKLMRTRIKWTPRNWE